MKMTLRLSGLCVITCLMATCGSFNASYTDKQGVTYHGGALAPEPARVYPGPRMTTSDPKD